jgi:hypothetical protein
MIKNNLNYLADRLINDSEQFKKLQEFGNRKNYPHKVKLLQAKIQEEFDFWSKKEPSQKLLDIEKDRNFIQSIKEPTQNKERLDLLMSKYGLK